MSAILNHLFERFVGEPPQINEIDFKEVSISIGKNSRISVYELLGEIDTHLGNEGKTVWILLDKIDELFPSKIETRKEYIEGLFLAYIDFVSRFKNIGGKNPLFRVHQYAMHLHQYPR